ncbi:PREDICTED: E3 ubiquitin-protein ligase KCMF1-like [Chaetura pelagica]|uniref:E3 ubiquitin-protein ligase KCMF1-like n=1 Tax=Chaetura pelagica TaxID=8897 RepID=UPI00052328DB|nr:PREDICTED: E3 ubiquitin-protein ligase KCMF1-like [Chaetura pelagica]
MGKEVDKTICRPDALLITWKAMYTALKTLQPAKDLLHLRLLGLMRKRAHVGFYVTVLENVRMLSAPDLLIRRASRIYTPPHTPRSPPLPSSDPHAVFTDAAPAARNLPELQRRKSMRGQCCLENAVVPSAPPYETVEKTEGPLIDLETQINEPKAFPISSQMFDQCRRDALKNGSGIGENELLGQNAKASPQTQAEMPRAAFQQAADLALKALRKVPEAGRRKSSFAAIRQGPQEPRFFYRSASNSYFREGVSCDACLKGNFRGRRYKCLICYDYDLCATCYESGATTTRHTTDHPMQCILTRVDFDLYYGGEAFSVEQPQSFTCPYCGKMGYTETTLQEHVASEHAETSTEVICPICAALPGGDPNHVTDDFAAHLTLEHRAPRDLDESSGVRHVRRMFHPGRGLGGPRARRSNMHFTSSSTGGLSTSQSSYSPSNRETMDPIAELLSQLSGVRRSAGQLNSSGPSASQLQQLQMQLQLERQHAQAARQQLETARNATRRTNTSSIPTTLTQSIAATNTSNTESNQSTIQNSQFLLMRLNDPKMSEAERQSKESERADRSLFVQELLLSTLMQEESSSSDEDERGEIADFGAMGCVDIMPLDVALENLNLKESNTRNEPPL